MVLAHQGSWVCSDMSFAWLHISHAMMRRYRPSRTQLFEIFTQAMPGCQNSVTWWHGLSKHFNNTNSDAS